MALPKGRFNSGIKNLVKAKKGESIWKNYKRNLICLCCSKNYETTRPNAKYCSKECYAIMNTKIRKKSESFCLLCSKIIRYRRINNKDTKFCSKKCAGFFRTLSTEGKNYFYRAMFYHGPKCQICSSEKYEHLVVHHRDQNRKNNSFDNLQVLCANCHHEIHFGNGKTRKNRMNVYFEIMKEVPDAIKRWEKSFYGE